MARTIRTLAVLIISAAIIVAGPVVAGANHAPTTIGAPVGIPADVAVLQEGDWRFVANLPLGPGASGPLGVDWHPFSRDGRDYIVMSSMTIGLTVVDVTDPLAPVRVSDYASSFGCPAGAVEAIPEAGSPGTPGGGWENDIDITPDGRFVLIGTDEILEPSSRCHDPAGGGVEFVDLTDVANPRTLHLTRNTGQAHSITVDPFHPWLAYTSTSDGNELIDIIDFRSCLGGVAAIDDCNPSVARAQLTPEQEPGVVRGGEDLVSDGCHDIRFTATRAYCAAVGTTMIFDTSRVVGPNGRLTGTDLTSAGDVSCRLIDAHAIFAPGVKVTDCTAWTESAFDEAGARGADLELLSVIEHDASKPPTEDIQIAHQAEALDGERIMMVTDERGGGLGRGPNYCPGGGIWFYDIRDPRNPKLMTQPDGSAAVFITDKVFQTHGQCTVHYGTEFQNERLLVMAWYTQGTRVIRYTPNYSTSPATVAFDEVAAYIPVGASTWTSKGLVRNPENPDEIIIYTTDIVRGMDALAVRIPAPPIRGSDGGGGGPRVLGGKTGGLANTGFADPLVLALILIAGATLITRWMRRVDY